MGTLCSSSITSLALTQLSLADAHSASLQTPKPINTTPNAPCIFGVLCSSILLNPLAVGFGTGGGVFMNEML